MGKEKPLTASNGLRTVLSSKQEAVAVALASGKTLDKAANETGVGARTIRTWTHDQPAFNARVSELRAEMTALALGRLVDSMAGAADTLGYLSRKGKSEMVRLGAARSVLEFGIKIRESVELEARLSELEAKSK